MKGLIICGYPGVGKSSIAGWNNCIDLESSWFFKGIDNGNKPEKDWAFTYFSLATNIANQGYTVLTSTHSEVIRQLSDGKRWYSFPIVIFTPRPDMKNEWAERLLQRCLKAGNLLSSDKNYRALSRIRMWESDMKELMEYDLPIYSPKSIDYDLRDYVKLIRQKEGLDDEVTSETDTPVA